ncbi:MAG: hypothetical protein CMM31_07515, partial [Rhodospirillaceae bacterium]|nr:hypothetical protein [Rhodospirillaceae bacterium]
MAIRTRPIIASITLSLLLTACGAGSLPSQRSQDKTPPPEEQTTVTQEGQAAEAVPEAFEPVTEPEPAKDEEVVEETPPVSDSEEQALAELTEAVEAELERASARTPEVVKVGLLLPLTGSLTGEGAALLDAAQLALF